MLQYYMVELIWSIHPLTLIQQFADNEVLQAEWASAKMANKKRLAQYILQVTGLSIDPNSLFDIQVKRIHEYKRQLMNILGAIYRYKKLKVCISLHNFSLNAHGYIIFIVHNQIYTAKVHTFGAMENITKW